MKLTIQASTHAYDVHIKEDIRFHIQKYFPKHYDNILIITDDVIEDLYLQEVKNSLTDCHVHVAVIKNGEASKAIDTYYELQTIALEKGLDRKSLILALGGGVIGDLAGFVAATFMRGIDFIQMPTTILAHDSSVGGKVAINHPLGKNMIGSFHAPVAVLYDTAMLTSLPAHEVRSGYAELMKEAFIADTAFVETLFQTDLTKVTKEEISAHLYKGIQIKAAIVEADEKEANVRKYLNLGHTLGHAIEAQIGYGKMTHGEAIAIGMLFAFQVSEDFYGGNLPHKQLHMWMKENNYPFTITLDVDKTIKLMQADKKAENKTIQMVLLDGIGEVRIENIDDAIIVQHLHAFKEEVRVK